MNIKIKKPQKISGTVSLPGDKSVSHRALILSSLADGISMIDGLARGEDIFSTIRCLRSLGVEIEEKNNKVYVYGKGLKGFSKPKAPLNAGNSGTTIRILSGLLAFQDFTVSIGGDKSLNRRPMKRIIEPLLKMGCKIESDNSTPPLKIWGSHLKGIDYKSPVSSAQLKSSVLIAGLGASGRTVFREKEKTRNHTEIMLKEMGVPLTVDGADIILKGPCTPKKTDMNITGDFSSAAPFIAATLCVPQSELTISNIGLNPRRTGFLEIIKKMGANFTITDETVETGEQKGTLKVFSSRLKGIAIGEKIIPDVIDELPLIALLATQAEGKTLISGAGELRIKESDRISSTVYNLAKLGASIEERSDGMVITGGNAIKGGEVDSFGDHRIVMAMAAAGAISEEPVLIKNAQWVKISYPGFFEDLIEIFHD